MGTLGRLALAGALVAAVFGIAAFVLGAVRRDGRWVEVGRRALYGVALLTTVASAALVFLLVTSDFRYEYVANYTTRDLDLLYKIGAFWGGNAGSLLLWVWVLSLLSAAAVSTRHPGAGRLQPWVGTFLLVTAAFFLTLVNFVSPPFRLLPEPAAEGRGLNPLLQNPGMMLHPIYTYLGYVGFSVPYAYAMAALITGDTGDVWLRVTRRWTLLAWLFLSMGILYGGQWAYVELGWGGYWAWDPVENSSLMPWLTGTAFLHTAVVQEQRGMLKGWNVVLIVITFLLTIFGTFLTRSGVVVSVHAFANGPLGAFFLGFIGIMAVVSVYLLIDRSRVYASPHGIESLLSREASFLLNNLLLLGITFATLWGTLLPVTSELVTGMKVGVGPPFFNQVNVPLGLALVLLMGLGPLLPWRRAQMENLAHSYLYPVAFATLAAAVLLLAGVTRTAPLVGFTVAAFAAAAHVQEFIRGVQARCQVTGERIPVALVRLISRNRRRYGGYLVHLAIVVMVTGFIGSSAYSQEATVTLRPGEPFAMGRYVLTHRGVWAAREDDHVEVFARLGVSKDGRDIGVLRPEKQLFRYNEQPTTEVAVLGGLAEDLYVVLGGWDDTGAASYKIYINPLVAWVWIGQYLLLAGTLVALWPEPERVTSGRRVGTPGTLPAPAEAGPTTAPVTGLTGR